MSPLYVICGDNVTAICQFGKKLKTTSSIKGFKKMNAIGLIIIK